MSDSFDLRRFVEAQGSVYPQVVEELSRGRKESHWMWFVFPQIARLGSSAMAQRYAIGSRGEAIAYLAHDVLGPRLIECTRLVMAASEKTINDILGSPDDMKFRSSMTLFDAVSTQKVFPCIIAGLRDYAEFIPLERELFDLVIIDEASQVSIAQALPAIIRAKKILVLGDRNQFGKVPTMRKHYEAFFVSLRAGAGPTSRLVPEGLYQVTGRVTNAVRKYGLWPKFEKILRKHKQNWIDSIDRGHIAYLSGIGGDTQALWKITFVDR